MVKLISITDMSNVPMITFNFGDIRFGDISFELPFRLWNNRLNLYRGIEKAININIILTGEPLPQNRSMEGRNVVEARCTYSGKTNSPITEDYRPFPINSTLYDELEPGSYNDYLLRVDLSQWPEDKYFLVADLLAQLWLITEFD